MINVMMVVPNRTDSTSYYRSMGPLSALSKKYRDINLVFSNEADWAVLKMMDLVFMQRPFNDAHVATAKLCKMWDVPMWIDFDDLLFSVPTDNPAYDFYSNQKIQNNIVEITKAATCVSVSTPQLKRCLQLPNNCLNDNVFVIPNAMDPQFWKKRVPFSYKHHFNWRGTNTHMKDLATHAEELNRFVRKHPTVTMTFLGYNPWFVTENLSEDQCIVVPPMDIWEYQQFMVKTNPAFQFVPLSSSMFNLCKSNIAWMEAAAAGAITLCPDWEEWQVPGTIRWKDPDDFTGIFESCLTKNPRFEEMHKEACQFIEDHLMLDTVNEARAQLIYGLVAGRLPLGGEKDAIPEASMVLQ